jgi:DNA-binding response OmpR family regulator
VLPQPSPAPTGDGKPVVLAMMLVKLPDGELPDLADLAGLISAEPVTAAVVGTDPEPAAPVQRVMTCGPLTVDPGTRTASLRGVPLDLTSREFGLLAYLARRPGWVYTRVQLTRALGGHLPSTGRSIDVLVSRVRHKLGEDGALLRTVRGTGYGLRGDA